MIDGKWYWHILDKLEPSGAKLADSNKAEQIILTLGSLHARKWHKEIAEKEDLGKYGLTTPTIVATMTVKKHPYTARGAGAAVAAALHRSPLPFATSLLADFLADPGEAVTIEFGKEDKEDKEKFTYAKHSGRNLLFSVDSDRPDFVKKQDLRDRTFQMYAHALRGISFVTMSGVDPISLLNFASPHITGRALEFDPEKVTKINLSVRTAYELRTFQFDRIAKEKPKEPEKTKVDDKGKEQPKEAGKDKEQPKDAGKDKEQPKDKGKVAAKDDEKKESPWTWTDKSNIPEFQLDPEKVAQFLKDTSKLETNRFVVFAGGPRGEHKLDAKEATIKLDLLMDNGKTITLLVGASYLGHGYFATSNVWSDADGKLSTVFFLSPNFVMPILSGTDYFGKQRIAAD
jgi:hypothetical protein